MTTHKTDTNDRLDVWYDGSAIAIGSQGDPLDFGEHEGEAFIDKPRMCVL